VIFWSPFPIALAGSAPMNAICSRT